MWDSPYATSHQKSSTLMDRWSLTSLQDEGVDPGNAIKMTSDLRMGSGFLHFFESRSSHNMYNLYIYYRIYIYIYNIRMIIIMLITIIIVTSTTTTIIFMCVYVNIIHTQV